MDNIDVIFISLFFLLMGLFVGMIYHKNINIEGYEIGNVKDDLGVRDDVPRKQKLDGIKITEETKNSKLSDTSPNPNDIVKYTKEKEIDDDGVKKLGFDKKQYNICSAKDGFKIEKKPDNLMKCKNSSIQKKIESGPLALKANQLEAQYNETNDFTSFYTKKYNFPKMYLGDPQMLSANYQEYTNYAKPEQVDIKIVPSNFRGARIGEYGMNNIPEPANYAFMDSPALQEINM